MGWSKNENATRRPDCGCFIGMDSHWNMHDHCNLACKWLGKKVSFILGGVKFTGDVVETQRHRLCNGVHDILTVEIDDNGRQIKIQGHRQSFTRLD